MASLDVSDAFDATFLTPLIVDRQIQTVNNYGETVVQTVRIDPAPVGVIVPKDSVIGGNFISREPDEQHRGAALVVFTNFRLQSVSKSPDGLTEYAPDIVTFNGNPYMVGLINDFSIWGAGYIKAELTSQEAVDNSPDSAS